MVGGEGRVLDVWQASVGVFEVECGNGDMVIGLGSVC